MPPSDPDTLKVRDLAPADVELLKAYWSNQTASDIDRLRLDPAKLQTRVAHIDALLSHVGTPYASRTSDLLIWELTGRDWHELAAEYPAW